MSDQDTVPAESPLAKALETLMRQPCDTYVRPNPGHILVFGAHERDLKDFARAFNALVPGLAEVAPRGSLSRDVLKRWWDGAFPVLLVHYRQCHGWRAPDDTEIILLDGCPDPAYRAQALSRVRNFR